MQLKLVTLYLYQENKFVGLWQRCSCLTKRHLEKYVEKNNIELFLNPYRLLKGTGQALKTVNELGAFSHCVCVQPFSCVCLFATLRAAAQQTPLSMGCFG